MIKVSYILLLIATCFCAKTFGQDKIYLKNGSVIIGNIQSVENASIGVTSDSSHFRIYYADIYRIAVRSNVKGNELRMLTSVNRQAFQKNFEWIVQVALLTGGESESREPFPGVSGIASYQFGRFFQFGAGMDYNTYADFRSMPLYLYYKADLFMGRDGFFYYSAYGYGKVWEPRGHTSSYKSVKGGAVMKAGIGYIFGNDKVRIISSVGWIQQQMQSEGELNHFWVGDFKTIISRSMNRIEVKFGISI